jgi:hypothetical protein
MHAMSAVHDDTIGLVRCLSYGRVRGDQPGCEYPELRRAANVLQVLAACHGASHRVTRRV